MKILKSCRPWKSVFEFLKKLEKWKKEENEHFDSYSQMLFLLFSCVKITEYRVPLCWSTPYTLCMNWSNVFVYWKQTNKMVKLLAIFTKRVGRPYFTNRINVGIVCLPRRWAFEILARIPIITMSHRGQKSVFAYR